LVKKIAERRSLTTGREEEKQSEPPKSGGGMMAMAPYSGRSEVLE